MTDETTPLIDPDAIGVELSWSFGDGSAEAVTMLRDDFAGLLSRHGFDPLLVPEVDENKALGKAQHTVKGRSRQIVIQELRRPNKDTPKAYGVYRVVACEGESGDDVVMRARVRCQGKQVVCLPPEGMSVFEDAECETVGAEIARIGNTLIDNVINRDISDVLVEIGWKGLGWLSRRRNSGGVYFAHTADESERFVALLKDIADLSERNAEAQYLPQYQHSHHFIPQLTEVYPKPLTMDSWRGSASDQYEAQTAELIKQLQKMQGDDGDKMRDKTVQGHADECDRLMKLAEGHRLFLADSADTITDELTRIRDAFADRLAGNIKAADDAFTAIEESEEPVPTRKRRGKRVPVPTRPKTAAEMTDDEAFNMG